MAKDAGNRFYWRANRRRLTAEQIRDACSSVSGTLEDKMGGPSVALTPTGTRRTVYGKVSRYKLDQFLQLFDFPAPTISAEQRFSTNVPLQRLFFMNSDFMQQQAEQLAAEAAGGAGQPRARDEGVPPWSSGASRRRPNSPPASNTWPPNRCAPTKSAGSPTKPKKKEIEKDPKKATKPPATMPRTAWRWTA